MTGRVQRPVLVPTVWQRTVTAAGGRCECAGGACGSRHTRTQGRCPAGGTNTVPVRLYAAPVPGAPKDAALLAWCATCLDGARRRHARQVEQTAAEQPDAGGQLDALAYLAALTDALPGAGGAAPDRDDALEDAAVRPAQGGTR